MHRISKSSSMVCPSASIEDSISRILASIFGRPSVGDKIGRYSPVTQPDYSKVLVKLLGVGEDVSEWRHTSIFFCPVKKNLARAHYRSGPRLMPLELTSGLTQTRVRRTQHSWRSAAHPSATTNHLRPGLEVDLHLPRHLPVVARSN
jgi:hypothetical protein